MNPYSVELDLLKQTCKAILSTVVIFLILSINTPPDDTVPPFRSYHTMAGAVIALTTFSFKALALPQISTSRPPISTSRQIKFSTQALSLPQKSGQESISISSNNQIFTAHFYRDGNTIYANTAGLIGTRDSLKNANTLLLKELKNQFPENQGYNVELNKDYQFDHAGHKHNSQAWGIRGSDMSTPTYDQSIGTLIPSSLNKHKNKDYHGCNQGPSLLDSNFVSPGDFYFENGNRYEAGLWEFAEKTGANLNETVLSIKGIKASHTKLKTSIEDYFESSEVDKKETLIAGYSETVLHSLNCDANTVVGLKMFPNSGARHVFLNNFTKHALRASKYVRSSINLCQRSSSNYRLSRLKLLSTHETLIILNLKAVVQYQGQIDSNFNVEYWVVRINRLENKFEKLNRDLLPLEDLHKEALDSGMEVYDVFNGRQGRFIYNRRF